MSVETQLQMAISLYQQDRFSEAEDFTQRVLTEHPKHPEALQLLGLIAFECGHSEAAFALIQEAIQNQPDKASFRVNLGNCFLRLHRYNEALQAFESALNLQPDLAEALNKAAIIYQEFDNHTKALHYFEQALIQSPGSIELQYNLAVALRKQAQFQEALKYTSQVLTANPQHADAWNNRGLIRQELNQLDKAQTDFEQAIRLEPQHPEAHLNLGALQILRGQLPIGWDNYEWRWDCPDNAAALTQFEMPRWQGQPLAADQRLWVHADAGFGDSLQFVRYLLDSELPAKQITFACQKALLPLFEAQNWPFEICDKAQVSPDAAYEFPLLSFPALQRTSLATIPQPEPYLSYPEQGPALPEAAADYQQRIAFVWSGSADNAINTKRSCELKWFRQLMQQFPEIYWVSLQKQPNAQELAQDTPSNCWNADPVLESFADTAYLLKQVDLLISVDTSVVHLAGALGHPTWVLLPQIPDWRWLLECQDTPWYQQMRLFRQSKRNDWKQLFWQVKKALQAQAHKA